ncbi:hypothetical protein C8T65DRAFT_773989 [Cerioporus squamosus]|nr:hypothetical protein C8T65DRAFT_773989 [Cerioporus squamosus]
MSFEVTALEFAYTNTLLSFSIITLLTYDIVLGLEREVNYVWMRRGPTFRVMYGVNRYACLTSFVVDMLQRYQTNAQVCKNISYLYFPLSLIEYIQAAVYHSWLNGDGSAVSDGLYPQYKSLECYNSQTMSPLTDDAFNPLGAVDGWSHWRKSFSGTASYTSDVYMTSRFISLPMVMTVVAWVLEQQTSLLSWTLGGDVAAVRDAISSVLLARFMLDLAELSAAVDTDASSPSPALSLTTDLPLSISISDLPPEEDAIPP